MHKKKRASRLLALMGSAAMSTSLLAALPVAAAEETSWIGSASLQDVQGDEIVKDSVLPDANQYRYQKAELAAFCHFGPNTFNEIEWGEHYGSQSPAQIFRLKNDFDEDTYVRALKDAGFTKLIVTAKHHDGFCIWDSQYTDYDAAAAGYKDGKGDVLAELSAACTKYGLEMGLYLSPWDIHDDSYGYYDANGNPLVGSDGKPLNGRTWEEVEELDVKDYNEYYNNQLQEILGNPKYGSNGHFSEVWMDGAKGSGTSVQNYDFNRWFETIQANEGKAAGYDADCMLFGAESYTGVRWIGNENGYAHKNTWSKSITDRENNTIDSNSSGGYTKGWENGNQWTVPEADARITSGWFWGNSKKTPKSLKDLGNMYFGSVGNNAVFLLNIPPNSDGTVDEQILERVSQFGQAISETFDDNIAASSAASVKADSVRSSSLTYSPDHLIDGDDASVWAPEDGKNTAKVLLDLGGLKTFDVVSIEEAIQFGQRINSWKVEALTANGSWKTLDEGETIGAHKLVRTGSMRASQIRITVSTPEGKVPVLSEAGVYKTAEAFELTGMAPDGMDVIDIDDGAFSFTGTWYSETGDQYINGTNKYANPGAEAQLSFHGTRAWLVGTLDPNHGTADIYVDGELAETINMTASPRRLGQRLFDTGDLADGDHTIRVVTKTKATGLEAAYVIDNEGKGMIGLESAAYTMNEDETINVKLVRMGAGSQSASVTVSPNPGSAIQDDFDTELITTVTFGPGETEKTVPVRTRRNTNATGDLQFSIEVSSADEAVILGFNDRAVITIKDAETMTAALLQERIDAAKTLDGNTSTGDWQTLAEVIARAQAVCSDPASTVAQLQAVYDELGAVMEGFGPRALFTAEDPFVFPAKRNGSTVLEGEYAQLEDKVLSTDGKWSLCISEGDWASGGKFINCFNQTDIVRIPYTAAKAGTYQAEVFYRSGDPKNNLVWSEPDGKIADGQVTAGAPNTSATHSVTFDVVVTEPGSGVWTFTGPDDKSPQIDRFVITAKELDLASFTISSQAGTGGTITPSGDENVVEGESLTYTITPDAGYEIADVLVNGESVGAVSSYTFENVQADASIEARFAFVHYSAANPFVFPETEGALEAEEMELHNTGENEAWPMQISQASWCGNGKFVNAMNTNDTAVLYYNAPAAGRYTFTLHYRSGDSRNSLSWSEKDNKIEAGSVTAGAPNTSATHTASFVLNVREAGEGVLTFQAGEKNAPQMDRFDIVREIDTAALQNLIDQASALLENSSSYTPESIQNLQQALEAADAALNAAASQQAIDEAMHNLQSAIDSLQEAEVNTDKRLLAMALSYAHSIQPDVHVNAIALQNFETALAQAETVYVDPAATQQAVDKAWKNLAQAIHMLSFTSDKTDLAALVSAAQAIDCSQYEDGALKDEFLAALEAARTVLEDPAALDSISIQPAADRLQAAMDALLALAPEEIDTSLLELLVHTVESTDLDAYTETGKEELQEALQEAKSVLAAPRSSAQVDASAARLHQAWLNLRLKADESLLARLQQIAARLESADLSAYTADLAGEIKAFARDLNRALADHESGAKQIEAVQAQSYIEKADILFGRMEAAASSAPAASQKKAASVSTAAFTGTGTALFTAASAVLAGLLGRRKR